MDTSESHKTLPELPIQLVATDLDGTLLNDDEQVSARTRDAVHRALDAGVHVVLVTGRPPRWMPPVLAALDRHVTCVCANGALIFEPKDLSISHVKGLTRDEVVQAAEVLREVVPEVGFAIERAPRPGNLFDHAYAFAHDLEYRPRWAVPEGVQVAPLSELIDDRPVLKLLARSELRLPQHEVDIIVDAARTALNRRVEVTHSERDRLLLEVAADNVNKGSALATIAADLGIDAAHTAAVGDMPNDLPMLEWATHKYAVANAHPYLLAVATTLASNNDDAVAQLLEAAAAGELPTSPR